MPTLLQEPPRARPAPEAVTGYITVERYHEMIAAGDFDRNPKFELIRGRLVEKMPRSDEHILAKELLDERLAALLPPGWFCRPEAPVGLADSEPEPDLMVVRGQRRDYGRRRPTPADVALLIEVSMATLGYERNDKRDLYAEAGIQCYWIVNLINMRIEVREAPVDGVYTSVRNYAVNEPVPIVVDGREIGSVALSELLC